MILSIHQPSYFPWLGLLHKIAASDLYLVMDEVQLADRAYQHRNLFLAENGETKYLSIPFVRKGYRDRPLRMIEIADPHWEKNHRNFLWSNYRKHPFSEEIMPRLDGYFAISHATLFEAILASMRLVFELLELPVQFVLQSSLTYDRSLSKGDLIVALARATEADCYLSGIGAQTYLDERAFGDNLSLRYDRFFHPIYPQKNVQTFVPGLSCLDMLFNLGIEGARACLRTEPDS